MPITIEFTVIDLVYSMSQARRPDRLIAIEYCNDDNASTYKCYMLQLVSSQVYIYRSVIV